MREYEYDLFLSCAGEDIEFAQRLRAHIERAYCEGQPLKVFLYKGRRGGRDDLLSGGYWPEDVVKALEVSRIFGYVLSPASVSAQARWVREEFNIFWGLYDRDIIPLLRQDCEIPPPLQVRWRIDFRDDTQFEEGIEKLFRLLCPSSPAKRVSRIPESSLEEGKKPDEAVLSRRTTLANLEDLARTGDLKRFAETDLIEDGVRWEVVCRGIAEPQDQAIAVFTVYNRRGEKGLKQLQRRIALYKSAQLK